MRTFAALPLLLAMMIVAGCGGPSADKIAAGAAVDSAVKVRTLMSHPSYDQQPAEMAYAEFQQAMSRAEREAAKSLALPWLQKCLSDVLGMRAERGMASMGRAIDGSTNEADARFSGHLSELDQHIAAAKAALAK